MLSSFRESFVTDRIPAWQRLQAVRAVELYRNLVLQSQQPSLHHIRQTLGRLADQERACGNLGSGHSIGGEQELVGRINPNEPEVLQQM